MKTTTINRSNWIHCEERKPTIESLPIHVKTLASPTVRVIGNEDGLRGLATMGVYYWLPAPLPPEFISEREMDTIGFNRWLMSTIDTSEEAAWHAGIAWDKRRSDPMEMSRRISDLRAIRQ